MSELTLLTQQLFYELEALDWPYHSRGNIQRPNELRGRGFCLGKIIERSKFSFQDSRKTKIPKYSEVYRLAREVMKAKDPDFYFTSIQFNKNSRAAKHRDGQNNGPSYMLGLGDYDGGDIIIYDENGENPVSHKTKNEWVYFDGNKYPHETAPFLGTRFTIVFYDYTPKKFRKEKDNFLKKS